MTDLRTAAQQALEALEYGQHTLKQVSENQWESRGALAMQALRAALAEPVQEPVAHSVGRTLHWHQGKGVSDAQLFAATPQRKPPIADEALWEMWVDSPSDVLAFARRIEMWHGITGDNT